MSTLAGMVKIMPQSVLYLCCVASLKICHSVISLTYHSVCRMSTSGRVILLGHTAHTTKVRMLTSLNGITQPHRTGGTMRRTTNAHVHTQSKRDQAVRDTGV